MTIVTPQFLRDVQEAGWQIKGANEGAVLGGCPREGCSLKVNLKPGRPLPVACTSGKERTQVVVRTFEDARIPLRERRKELGLTIKEMEEIAGITVDYAAKFEKDNPSKIPNAETFFEWAQALGYDVVLVPSALPSKALSYIANSRDQQGVRKRMENYHAQRKAKAT